MNKKLIKFDHKIVDSVKTLQKLFEDTGVYVTGGGFGEWSPSFELLDAKSGIDFDFDTELKKYSLTYVNEQRQRECIYIDDIE